MSEKLAFFVIGVVAGLIVNLLLDAVRSWRANEQARRKVRAFLVLLQAEVSRRIFILQHRSEDSEEQDFQDALQHVGSREEATEYLEKALSANTVVFRENANLLPDLSLETVQLVGEHYLGIAEHLRGGDGSFSALPKVRREAKNLLSLLGAAEASFKARSFVGFVPKWLAGKA